MWEIEASDEEAEGRPSEGDKKSSTGSDRVPVRIALLYLQIEKEGVLKLKTTCPRRGPTKRKSTDSQLSNTASPLVPENEENKPQQGDLPPGNEMLSRSKPEMRAFSYEDEEDAKPNSNTPRRNPTSAKKPKKIASMTNVVSDLVRHKKLDELESSTNEGKPNSGPANAGSTEATPSSAVRLPPIADPKKK